MCKIIKFIHQNIKQGNIIMQYNIDWESIGQFLIRLKNHVVNHTFNPTRKGSFIMGIISGLAFAPLFLFPMLFSLSILCYQIKSSKSIKDTFVLGLLFGFGHFLSSIYWMSIGLTVYINEFWWAIPFALFGLPLIFAIFIASSCSLSWLFRNNSYYHFIFCFIFVLFEWFESYVIFGGCPWNLMGYSLAFSDKMIQLTNVMGIYGLSFITVYAFSSIYFLIVDEQEEFLASFFVSSLLMMLIGCFGHVRITENPTTYTNVKVRLVQPSIPQSSKWDENKFWKNLNTQINLSLGKDDVDLIVWPESALTVPYKHPEIKEKLVDELLSKSNAILITGAVSDNNKTNKEREVYTTISAIAPNGDELFEYHKSHLVPFAEYMPLKNILPFKKLTHGILDFSPGKSNIFKLKELNLSLRPLICFESIFPEEVKVSNADVDVLLNVTNDSWFGWSSGPFQHFYQSKVRAAENGVPMIRVASNGISAVIDAYGRVVKRIGLNNVKSIDAVLPGKLDYVTLYSEYGDLTALAFVIFVLMFQYIIKKLM